MMKNAFYFILTFWAFRKDKGNLKIYDVTAWLIKNYDTHIAQYLTN